ncbi:MAG: DNA-processing protein DprA [Clostridia bacterium]|nr:DNA-processing protein DprA [Clostridia bacterium]
MYTQDEINLITLSSFDSLSYNIKYQLLSKLSSFGGDFSKYENILIKTLPDGVYNKVKAKFYDPDYRKALLDALEKRGIKCVTYLSDEYPESLKNIPDPPINLYCKGDTTLLKTKCFSIVGSRKSTPKCIADTKKLSSEISQKFTVVSGMAEGADTAAIEGAIENGKVISVLAYGFDYAYPAVNANLINKVANEGLLISEHPPKIKPQAYMFPVRNRIIAGLSQGTLIVSAGIKSGALITANYAADYGRDVFVFPYYPGTSSGAGCNCLLKNGAIPAENILDIFKEFGLDFNKPKPQTLTEDESEVLSAVRELEEALIAQVADKLNKPAYKLIPIIASLEMKGLVVNLGGNRYSAV